MTRKHHVLFLASLAYGLEQGSENFSKWVKFILKLPALIKVFILKEVGVILQ